MSDDRVLVCIGFDGDRFIHSGNREWYAAQPKIPMTMPDWLRGPVGWRPIKSLGGDYEASDDGHIRNVATGHTLSSRVGDAGYHMVSIRREGIFKTLSVHRLVAEAFCTKLSGCNVVNHLDSDRQNNRARNLEWTTQKGNIEHAKNAGRLATGQRHGRHTMPERSARGERSGRSVMTAEHVVEMRALRASGWSLDQLVEKFGFKKTTICAVCMRKNWKHIP